MIGLGRLDTADSLNFMVGPTREIRLLQCLRIQLVAAPQEELTMIQVFEQPMGCTSWQL